MYRTLVILLLFFNIITNIKATVIFKAHEQSGEEPYRNELRQVFTNGHGYQFINSKESLLFEDVRSTTATTKAPEVTTRNVAQFARREIFNAAKLKYHEKYRSKDNSDGRKHKRETKNIPPAPTLPPLELDELKLPDYVKNILNNGNTAPNIVRSLPSPTSQPQADWRSLTPNQAAANTIINNTMSFFPPPTLNLKNGYTPKTYGFRLQGGNGYTWNDLAQTQQPQSDYPNAIEVHEEKPALDNTKGVNENDHDVLEWSKKEKEDQLIKKVSSTEVPYPASIEKPLRTTADFYNIDTNVPYIYKHKEDIKSVPIPEIGVSSGSKPGENYMFGTYGMTLNNGKGEIWNNLGKPSVLKVGAESNYEVNKPVMQTKNIEPQVNEPQNEMYRDIKDIQNDINDNQKEPMRYNKVGSEDSKKTLSSIKLSDSHSTNGVHLAELDTQLEAKVNTNNEGNNKVEATLQEKIEKSFNDILSAMGGLQLSRNDNDVNTKEWIMDKPGTFGINMKGDNGYVWNKLTPSGHKYYIDEQKSSSKFKRNKDDINNYEPKIVSIEKNIEHAGVNNVKDYLTVTDTPYKYKNVYESNANNSHDKNNNSRDTLTNLVVPNTTGVSPVLIDNAKIEGSDDSNLKMLNEPIVTTNSYNVATDKSVNLPISNESIKSHNKSAINFIINMGNIMNHNKSKDLPTETEIEVNEETPAPPSTLILENNGVDEFDTKLNLHINTAQTNKNNDNKGTYPNNGITELKHDDNLNKWDKGSTYGMIIRGGSGHVWNKLSPNNYEYFIGDQNTGEQIEDHKKEIVESDPISFDIRSAFGLDDDVKNNTEAHGETNNDVTTTQTSVMVSDNDLEEHPTEAPDNLINGTLDTTDKSNIDPLIQTATFWKWLSDWSTRFVEIMDERMKYLVAEEVNKQLTERKNYEKRENNEHTEETPKKDTINSEANKSTSRIKIDNKTIHGNSLGNDHVTNIFILYPNNMTNNSEESIIVNNTTSHKTDSGIRASNKTSAVSDEVTSEASTEAVGIQNEVTTETISAENTNVKLPMNNSFIPELFNDTQPVAIKEVEHPKDTIPDSHKEIPTAPVENVTGTNNDYSDIEKTTESIKSDKSYESYKNNNLTMTDRLEGSDESLENGIGINMDSTTTNEAPSNEANLEITTEIKDITTEKYTTEPTSVGNIIDTNNNRTLVTPTITISNNDIEDTMIGTEKNKDAFGDELITSLPTDYVTEKYNESKALITSPINDNEQATELENNYESTRDGIITSAETENVTDINKNIIENEDDNDLKTITSIDENLIESDENDTTLDVKMSNNATTDNINASKNVDTEATMTPEINNESSTSVTDTVTTEIENVTITITTPIPEVNITDLDTDSNVFGAKLTDDDATTNEIDDNEKSVIEDVTITALEENITDVNNDNTVPSSTPNTNAEETTNTENLSSMSSEIEAEPINTTVLEENVTEINNSNTTPDTTTEPEINTDTE